MERAHVAEQQLEERSSGQKLGLVLGAGGVRGCAHGGALLVLRRAGIRFDLVVGASIGAMFGLSLAAGISAERVAEVSRETSSRDLLSFYAARLRPTRSNRIARLLFEAGDGKNFDDLQMPFAVMATNVETGEPEVIDSGPVLPAVQASIALPLIARPVAMNGKYYLDGGIRDTAPVWAARRLGAERVVAICLGGEYGIARALRAGAVQRVMRVIGKQRRPISGSLIDQIRFGCRLMTSEYERMSCEADVAIWPKFDGLSPNSMFGAAFSFDRGVLAGRQALSQVLQLGVMPSASTSAAIGGGNAKLRTNEII